MSEESIEKAIGQPVPDEGADEPASPRKARRWGCLRTGILLLLVFCSGLVCGAGLTLRAIREHVQHPERRVERATRWMERRLDLSDEQSSKVRGILERQRRDLGALRDEVRPRVVERIEQTNEEIEEVLTAEQREEWREFVHRFRERWLPPTGEASRGPGQLSRLRTQFDIGCARG